ncbi:DNA alkylation repair protein [Luteolibacter sp. Populi]|uniref:DNA alkylation repair protein n=1 Tax=Luteolibacter sp. Populi TaxID=3230487 RepID=UPI0034673376
MAASSKKTKTGPAPSDLPVAALLKQALDGLKAHATQADLDGMARYAIPSDQAFGVAMNKIQAVAKQFGRNHELAEALWQSGWYEARLLAAYVDDPAQMTAAQMDRWCADFDNWAVCDTLCFALFDRTPHAWAKVAKWAAKKDEFQKRAAFALLWGLTVHDKQAGDAPYLEGLSLIEAAATDERNFVKKAVDMALRATGKRNAALNAAAVKTARYLAKSADPTASWIGKHALKELTGPAVVKRVGRG